MTTWWAGELIIKLKIIKISSGEERLAKLLLRQTPGGLGVWGDCKFVVNQPIKECDWWVICHGSGLRSIETTYCDPDRVVYISMEPLENDDSIPNGFLDQFAKLVLCDKSVRHKNVVNMNVHTWWVGIEMNYINEAHEFSSNYSLDYDRLSTMAFPEKKNRISVVVSNKNFLPGHQQRLDFLLELMSHPVGKYIDIYGAGHLPIPDKWVVIHPYRYHLVLENSVLDNYWTEKLADAFLGFSVPIYHGCPNIADYFPKDSMILIDINDAEATAKNLLNLIENKNTIYSYNEKIEYCRTLILNKYNLFQIVSNICAEFSNHKSKKIVKLRPKKYFTGNLLKRIIKKYFFY